MNTMVGLGIAVTLADMFTPKLKNAEKGVDHFAAKLGAISTASVLVGKKLTASLTQHYENFADTAQKQGDLMSLGIDTKGMELITQKGIVFANTWSNVVAKDFIGAAYDIKSGISSLTDEGVGEMTRYALLTGKATKSNAETMSKVFALGYGIFRGDFNSDFDFGKKFSASIAATVQLFRTDGDDLARGISNLGATASKFGVSLEEELSILGMSKSAFDTAAEGATSYKAFLMAAGKAQKDLNMTFVDSIRGNMLPMVQILEKIKQRYGDLDAKEIDQLKKAFGSDEAVKIILALIDKTDELRDSENKLKEAQTKGLDYTKKMAEAREYGQESRLLADQLDSLSVVLGKSLAPAMGWVTTQTGDAVNWLTMFSQEHEGVMTVVSTGLVIFAGAATVLGTLGIAIASASFGLNKLGLKAIFANTQMKTATATAGRFRMALLGIAGAGLLVAEGLDIMSAAQQKSLHHKTVAGKGRDELLEQKKYLTDRLQAMKADAFSIEGMGERLLHGSVNQYKIKEYEKLLDQTNRKLSIPSDPGTKGSGGNMVNVTHGDVHITVQGDTNPEITAKKVKEMLDAEKFSKTDRSYYQ